MSNIVPTQQPANGTQLTKPADWSSFMVTAALKFVSDEKTPVIYSSQDAALLAILDTLNWYEAHSEYEWPNFTHLGFDFNQTMRFRRHLVNDVLNALKTSDAVKITGGAGVLGTPESSSVSRGEKRSADTHRMAERKRHCKREDGSDTEAASDNSDKPFWDDQEFLVEAMHELIGRSHADVVSYLRGEKSPGALADIVHDGLVSVWDYPVANHGLVPKELEKKRALWAQRKISKNRHSNPELGESHYESQGERGAPMVLPAEEHLDAMFGFDGLVRLA